MKDSLTKSLELLKSSPRGGQLNREWALQTKEILLTQIRSQSEVKVKHLSAWALSRQLFGQVLLSRKVLQPTAVLALLAVAIFGVNVITRVSANSLPGEFLYPLKIFSEKSQLIFTSSEDKAQVRLQFISNRLGELTEITQQAQVNKEQVQAVVNSLISETKLVQQDLERVASTTSQTTTLNVAKAVADQTNTTGQVVGQVAQQLPGNLQSEITPNLQQLLDVNQTVNSQSQGLIAASGQSATSTATSTSPESGGSSNASSTNQAAP